MNAGFRLRTRSRRGQPALLHIARDEEEANRHILLAFSAARRNLPPRGLEPDRLLEAMRRFRALYTAGASGLSGFATAR